ncbi:MAG: NAD-dependent deacylase [Deltaproteobacteria bacterium]|jgi:NAD-dependent deacetylase|nr:NAD-dependent deacylase [Deltaproteobacteria bacterium]
MTNLMRQVEEVAGLITGAKRVLVFTGAGVSTESGIPDFRGTDGIWQKYDPEDFTIQKFLSDKQVRKTQWQLLSNGDLSMSKVRPNPAHYAITELEAMGKLYGVVTQNVDGLHQKAGVSREIVFQLHGDLSHAVCLGCGRRYPMDRVAEWLNQGMEDPACHLCMGMLKPDAVLFGEQLPMKVLMESERRSRKCDICMVLGSTLSVYPACLIPQYAAQAGATLIIINMGPTELDHLAHIRIEGMAGDVAPKIVRLVKAKLEG